MSAFRSLSAICAAAAFLVAILAIATSSAHADGKMFAVQVADTTGAQIPDQSALICWENGVETLAIETRFVGRGTDFAWVVPLPSRPEVTPATKGTFPTLRAMFAPVVRQQGSLALPLIFALLLGSIWLYLRPWIAAVVGVVVVLLFIAVLLPSLGMAKARPAAIILEGPVVDRRIVGDFEVATLESPDGAAVTSWLRANSFHVSPNEEAVIGQHAREGWSFVATRMRREADSAEPSTAHPLVFKFSTPNPIYPMRLTGADSTRDLSVELFVLGPSRAAADDFKTSAAAPLNLIDDPYQNPRRAMPREAHINIAHHAVRAPAVKAAFGTRLTTVLAPAHMKQDVQLRWIDSGTTGRRAYNREGVIWLAVDTGLLTALCSLIVVGIAERLKRAPRGSALAIGSLLGLLIAGVVWLIVPSVLGVRVHTYDQAIYDLRDDAKLFSKTRLPLAEARERLAAAITRYRGNPGTPPPLIGDAPGQYDLRARDGIIWLIAHDEAGAENWTNLCATDDPDSE